MHQIIRGGENVYLKAQKENLDITDRLHEPLGTFKIYSNL